MEKDFFINAVQMIDVEGNSNIPTVLFYDRSKKVLIGDAALAEGDPEAVNEDFKVDLGNIDPESKKPRTPFFTATGVPKSAAELTADFIHELLKDVREWVGRSGLTSSPSLLLAEPLALDGDVVSEEWHSNYRRNLRRILVGKGFETIDFLPEPFAVFQYYRYGARHPLVAQRFKQNVLVVDYGGGTCDVCIIETTKAGDISQSNRNSKPLAAGSKPVGGFFINRIIAEDLLATLVGPKDSYRLKRGIETYMKWRRGKDDVSTYSPELRMFVRKFHSLIHAVENPKLSLCRSIRDWRLEVPLDLRVPTSVPTDPFGEGSAKCVANLSANRLRELFVDKVWRQQLKPLIEQTLRRGRTELEGAPISVVLLSGGSANIGWLKELISYEFGHQDLRGAEILPLPDYQEVVAKGLAVECARRFYNDTGDFSSVTYNRLCLILAPDESGCEPRPFLIQTNGLPNVQTTPGLLLPSASVLEGFIGKPMHWKVRLKEAPKNKLNYFFLRSSFDPDDVKNLCNLEEQIIHTPTDCPFDGRLLVELVVTEDGTAKPRFIYRSGGYYPEVSVTGRPFYVDMTSARDTSRTPQAYIGLDFGTSNSSVSFVDHSSVKVYKQRSEERQWKEFTELVDTLPYPLADSLARYLGQTNSLRLTTAAFEFVEAALSLAAYTTYAEYRSQTERRVTGLFRGLTKRSAGPLWKMLRECVDQLDKNVEIAAPYKMMMRSELFREVDSGITQLAQFKHGKLVNEEINHVRLVKIFANLSSEVFSSVRFGFFEEVKKSKFGTEFRGLFRHAHGKMPFIAASQYSGSESFSDAEAMIVDPGKGSILPLKPLVYWDTCKRHSDRQPPGHCYFYDSPSKTGKEFSYKAAGYPCSLEISSRDESGPLADEILSLRDKDHSIRHFLGNFRIGD